MPPTLGLRHLFAEREARPRPDPNRRIRLAFMPGRTSIGPGSLARFGSITRSDAFSPCRAFLVDNYSRLC